MQKKDWAEKTLNYKCRLSDCAAGPEYSGILYSVMPARNA